MNLFTSLFGRAAAAQYPGDPVLLAGRCASLDELGEFLSHRSGYVREAAVARTVQLRGAGALQALMPRLNDWVPQVRDAAQRAVLTLLPFAEPEEWTACLGQLWRLRQKSRWDHSRWIAQLEIELAARLGVARLRAAVQGADPLMARAAFQLLRAGDMLSEGELLEMAIGTRFDIVTAVQGVRLALAAPPALRQPLLQQAMGSQFGAVRTLALRGLLALEMPGAEGLALQALADAQGSVRSVAQYFLQRAGFDLAGHFRRQLGDAALGRRQACIALGALAALGGADDLPLVRRWSGSALPSVRGAALRSWLRLAPGDKDGIALQALADDSLGNRKLGARMVSHHGAFIPFERIQEVLQARAEITVLLSCARVRKWDWLQALATQAAGIDENDANWPLLATELARWLRDAHNAYDQPAPQQAAALRSPALVAALERLCAGNDWQRDTLHLELKKHCNWNNN